MTKQIKKPPKIAKSKMKLPKPFWWTDNPDPEIETTEETFKKNVPFSIWTSPDFKWKKWLLAPYKSAQKMDKFLEKFKKSTGGEISISKNVDRDLL